MHRLLLVGVLLLAGCQNVVGPREHRDMPLHVDDPCLSIGEQQRNGRDRLAIPDPTVAPRTYSELPRGYDSR